MPTFDKFESYYCLDSTYCNNILLYYIIHKDESCCLTAYLVSSKKQGKKYEYIDSKLVGLKGSDGDWDEIDILTSGANGINVIKNIEEHVSNPESGKYEFVVKTSIGEHLYVNNHGVISKQQTDSTSTKLALPK